MYIWLLDLNSDIIFDYSYIEMENNYFDLKTRCFVSKEKKYNTVFFFKATNTNTKIKINCNYGSLIKLPVIFETNKIRIVRSSTSKTTVLFVSVLEFEPVLVSDGYFYLNLGFYKFLITQVNKKIGKNQNLEIIFTNFTGNFNEIFWPLITSIFLEKKLKKMTIGDLI